MPSTFKRTIIGDSIVVSNFKPTVLDLPLIHIIAQCPYCKGKTFVANNTESYKFNEEITYEIYTLATCMNCGMKFYGGYDKIDKHFIMYDNREGLSDNDKTIIIKQAIANDYNKGFKEIWKQRNEEPRVSNISHTKVSSFKR